MSTSSSRMTSPRSTFRPFNYEWAFECWLKHEQAHWLHTEVPMSDDINDWNIANVENNCKPSVNKLNTAICCAIDRSSFAVNSSRYACLSAISLYFMNSLYVVSGIPSDSIRCEYAAMWTASRAPNPSNIIRISGCGKIGK